MGRAEMRTRSQDGTIFGRCHGQGPDSLGGTLDLAAVRELDIVVGHDHVLGAAYETGTDDVHDAPGYERGRRAAAKSRLEAEPLLAVGLEVADPRRP